MITLYLLFVIINSFKLSAGLKPSYRIIGGSYATKGEFPHHVSIRRASNNNHYCGGSILNESFIITAAHCMYSKDKKFQEFELFVVAGQLELDLYPNSTIRNLKTLIVHPGYSRSSQLHDVALLELAEKLPAFNKTKLIQPIVLNEEEVEPDLTCTVIGWGATEHDNEQNKIIAWTQFIQKADFKTISLKKCRKQLRRRVRFFVVGGTFCAEGIPGDDGAPVDSCKGDSGGPLLCSGRLTGLVSHGLDCAVPGHPGVYTDVQKHLEWIRYQTGSSLKLCSHNYLYLLMVIANKLANYYYPII